MNHLNCGELNHYSVEAFYTYFYFSRHVRCRWEKK